MKVLLVSRGLRFSTADTSWVPSSETLRLVWVTLLFRLAGGEGEGLLDVQSTGNFRVSVFTQQE